MPEPQVIEPAVSPPSELPAGSEPPKASEPSAPTSLDSADLRFSDDANVADWAKGKSAKDLVDLVENLRVAATAAPVAAPAPALAPVPAPVGDIPLGISADEIYSDTPGFVRSIEAFTNAKVAEGISQASTPLLQPLAGMARSSSMAEAKNKEVWDLYGPEIDLKMSSIPLQNRADPALWNQAVDMIAGEHRDDLARKAAERIIASAGDAGMLQTGGVTLAGGDVSSLSPIQVLFNEDHPSIQAFKDEGMTAATVVAHASRIGHTEEVYAEMLKSKTSRKYSTKKTV